ncbi:MAG: phage holin family protein [Pedobacter sp.]|nr:MAG: phage holin family protein [Pedobacter sp.]
MEQNKEKDIEQILSDAKEYVNTRIEYTKLSAIEKGAKIFADIITNTTVVVFFVLAFLFGTFTFALFLSDVLGSYTKGFGCVSLIYLFLSIILFLIKDKFIEPGLINMFIKKYFDKVADKDDEDEN